MIIDKEFQKIIPKLRTEEFAQLKENILKEGCRDALIVWNNTLVDGHNRYLICTENNIPFRTEEIEFESRSDAIEWIIDNQLGRRNIQDYQRGELVLKLKEVIQAKAKEKQQGGQGGILLSRNSDEANPMRTDEELAKKAGIGKDNMRKIEFIAQNGTENQKDRARKGGKGNTINAISKEVAFEQNKDKTKICKKCGEERPYSQFEVGRNVCEKCRAKQIHLIKEAPPQEPQERQYHEDPRYNHPLYDLSNVPQYSMEHLEVEINGSFENILSTLDGALEERAELFEVKENVKRFNESIKNIIKELKERIIDESKEN